MPRNMENPREQPYTEVYSNQGYIQRTGAKLKMSPNSKRWLQGLSLINDCYKMLSNTSRVKRTT
jgi:hypothetical protein